MPTSQHCRYCEKWCSANCARCGRCVWGLSRPFWGVNLLVLTRVEAPGLYSVSTPLLAHLLMYSLHWMCVVNLWMPHLGKSTGCCLVVEHIDSKNKIQKNMLFSGKMCPCVFRYRWLNVANDSHLIFGSRVSYLFSAIHTNIIDPIDIWIWILVNMKALIIHNSSLICAILVPWFLQAPLGGQFGTSSKKLRFLVWWNPEDKDFSMKYLNVLNICIESYYW